MNENCIFIVVQLLSQVWLFATPWTAAHQASLSFTISQSLLKLMSAESVMPSSHPLDIKEIKPVNLKYSLEGMMLELKPR